jgi:hypothetical protein
MLSTKSHTPLRAAETRGCCTVGRHLPNPGKSSDIQVKTLIWICTALLSSRRPPLCTLLYILKRMCTTFSRAGWHYNETVTHFCRFIFIFKKVNLYTFMIPIWPNRNYVLMTNDNPPTSKLMCVFVKKLKSYFFGRVKILVKMFISA